MFTFMDQRCKCKHSQISLINIIIVDIPQQ